MATSWTDSKAPSSSSRRDIQRIKIDGEVKLRLVGGHLPRYIYWVKTKEGKSLSIECLSFNRDTQSFDDSQPDPIKMIPDGIYTDKPSFGYICQAIDRKDGQLKLVDLRQTVFKAIVDLVKNPEYGNPADPEKGYDIYIRKEKTGPLPQNVKYTVTPGRNASPLTADEAAMELYQLDQIYKRPTFEEQLKWLQENTMYFAGVDTEALPNKEGTDDIPA